MRPAACSPSTSAERAGRRAGAATSARSSSRRPSAARWSTASWRSSTAIPSPCTRSAPSAPATRGSPRRRAPTRRACSTCSSPSASSRRRSRRRASPSPMPRSTATSRPSGSGTTSSEEQLDAALAQQGLTRARYRKQIKEELERAQLINREIRGKVSVSPEEIERYRKEQGDHGENGEADERPTPARRRERRAGVDLAHRPADSAQRQQGRHRGDPGARRQDLRGARGRRRLRRGRQAGVRGRRRVVGRQARHVQEGRDARRARGRPSPASIPASSANRSRRTTASTS